MALADTLTTREAVRRAALEDIVARCELAAITLGREAGELDGLTVITMGTLRDQVSGSLMVKLAPLLTVDDDGAEISVKAKASKMAHQHGQLSLDGAAAGDQLELDDVVIDDLRIRILTAVDDLNDELLDATEAGRPTTLVTLDAIAVRLEFATEHERGDLEESLYRYSQLEEPLIEIKSVAGEPVTYDVTEAGSDLLEADGIQAEHDLGAEDEQDEAP